MEFFNKVKAVKLRSHLDKYLLAGENEETVSQSGNSSSRKVRWTVEFVAGKTHVVRFKSCYGRYLTASDSPFLLGMTGKKVLQTLPATKLGSSLPVATEWEPIRDGFQLKFRSVAGKFLRANGGTPPWRNTVTHDVPHTSATKDWLLWDVEVVELPESDLFSDYKSTTSSFSSSLSDGFDLLGSEPTSPWSMVASIKSPRLSPYQIAMELFHKAKAVRLRSHHDKYLLAAEDENSICQDRHGSCRNARWTVEFIEDCQSIRLKSCYGKYLTASNVPFLLGMTGKKVLQTLPRKLDSSVEWEPIREGFQVKLKTRYGNFLRANGGLPPWRNSITHDIPHRTATQDWVLWDVDIVEIQVDSPDDRAPSNFAHQPDLPASKPSLPSLVSFKSSKLSKLESRLSFATAPHVPDGRTVYFNVVDNNGEVNAGIQGPSILFKGSGVDELKQVLEEETGFEDIIVCSHNPLNGKLYPLRLHLPPNNATMHVVVVKASSKAARDLVRPGIST